MVIVVCPCDHEPSSSRAGAPGDQQVRLQIKRVRTCALPALLGGTVVCGGARWWSVARCLCCCEVGARDAGDGSRSDGNQPNGSGVAGRKERQ